MTVTTSLDNMSNTPLGALPSIGDVNSSFSETCFPVVSGKLNSGARWPTCGAPLEAGSQRAAIKTVNTNSAITRTLRVATSELTIF